MKIRLSQVSYVLGDLIVACLAMWMTFAVRYDRMPLAEPAIAQLLSYCLIGASITLFTNLLSNAYNTLWIYISFSDVFKQVLTVGINGIFLLSLNTLGHTYLSELAIALYCFLLLFFTLSIRSIPRGLRWFRAKTNASKNSVRKVLILGAGAAGAMIIKRLVSNTQDGLYPVAVLDDDPQKHGTSLSGIPVVGSIDKLRAAAEKYKAQDIIIAIPSASPELLERIYTYCVETALPVKIFQSVVDFDKFVSGNRKALSDVPIEDLLSRNTVKPDMTAVREYIFGKTMLVTGGAGSIGSELCRQVLQYGCEHLIIFDIHENGLFELNEELKKTYAPKLYTLCVGSIRDEKRLSSIFERYKPQMVFHAAAHKHVPMMELNPIEAIKNNIFGTRNVLRCCIRHGTERFLLISSDKAVHPTNIMGATKRVAELLVQSMNGQGCEMTAVRFGNVLNSSGSVIPTFKRQIEAGGPVTVTHREIRRYFMTIPEAVSLVLCAGIQASGGEIFVLDMGNPVKIYDLACNMIRLSGYEPEQDIKIEITGLRPGEKLFEELSFDSETMRTTQSKKIFVLTEQTAYPPDFNLLLQRLNNLIQNEDNLEKAYELVFHIISEPRKESNEDTAELVGLLLPAK